MHSTEQQTENKIHTEHWSPAKTGPLFNRCFIGKETTSSVSSVEVVNSKEPTRDLLFSILWGIVLLNIHLDSHKLGRNRNHRDTQGKDVNFIRVCICIPWHKSIPRHAEQTGKVRDGLLLQRTKSDAATRDFCKGEELVLL